MLLVELGLNWHVERIFPERNRFGSQCDLPLEEVIDGRLRIQDLVENGLLVRLFALEEYWLLRVINVGFLLRFLQLDLGPDFFDSPPAIRQWLLLLMVKCRRFERPEVATIPLLR